MTSPSTSSTRRPGSSSTSPAGDDGGGSPASDDLSDALADLLAGPLAARPRIVGLERVAGGASRETWAFAAEVADARRELILRRDPPGRPGEPGAMALEARLMRVCNDAGLSVPAVIADDDGTILGAHGLVMTRVPGETLARRIQRDERFAPARLALTAQCGRFLAGLHALDPAGVAGLPELDPVDAYRERWRELDEVSPAFELAFRWLDAHRPRPSRSAIVHGDFRLGNLLVDEQGLAAVLDWELAHAGDPLEDLAWLCVKAWRFRQPAPVAGIGRFDELFGAYEGAGGTAVDRTAFHWWLVLDTLKWGVICASQAEAHLTGAHRSVELAAIGRRVAEQEWDLLELLDPTACRQALDDAAQLRFDEPAPDQPGAYGRPSARELLEAAREYVTTEVMPATGDAPVVQFHGRVAANVLAIVERELQLGPAQAARHLRLIDALGVEGFDALAREVRGGAWDDRGDELRPALAALARDRLAVAEPRHLTIPLAAGDTT